MSRFCCPKCGRRLFKGDVVVIREFVFDWEKGEFELNRKIAMCEKCGFVLGSRSSRHAVREEEKAEEVKSVE